MDTTAPSVTGLSDDSVVAKSKTWNWDCNEASCEYRYAVTQSSSTTPGQRKPLATRPRRLLKDTGDGEYFLHIQARDDAENESSEPDKFKVVLDNTAPAQQGEVAIGDGAKTYLYDEEMVFTVSFNENVVVDTSRGELLP